MFYFTHQIKLQTIPYVQKQINSFINYFQQHLNKKSENSTKNIQKDWILKTQKLIILMQKKYKQIQQFYYKNWIDYRASLILRSKQLLNDFYQQNEQLLRSPIHDNSNVQAQFFINEKKVINVEKQSQLNEGGSLSKQSKINVNSTIKESVKRIKTEMNEKSTRSNPKLSLKQNKKTPITPFNISKDQVSQQIQKIKKKQKTITENSSFVFSSRKKEQPLNQKNQKKQKNEPNKTTKKLSKDVKIFDEKLKGSLQKSLEKSKSKTIHVRSIKQTQKINLSKVQQNHLTKSIEKEKQIPLKTNTIRTKKMTKEQYVQYLVTKNRQKL